ncbi:hypothetical protein ES705_17863 [subsurface metagenome]
MSNPDKKILLDADVISHFIKGDQLNFLPQIFPNKLLILDIVKQEISRRSGWDQVIQQFIDNTDVQVVAFPQEIEFLKEYAHLTSTGGHALGKGESACLVYCRYNKDILASRNLKDILRYRDFHNIEYLTTKEILVEGYNKGILSEKDCNDFINKIKKKGSKFPYDTFSLIIVLKKEF